MSIERSDVPAYLQLAAILRERILSGEIGPKQPMPSTRSLHRDYGVAINTVNKAYALLKAEGLVRSVTGLGYFPSYPEDRPERE